MNFFYLKIIVLVFVILMASLYSYYKFDHKREEKEGFEKTEKTIILLGDSILKNNSYVKQGKSVEDLIKEKQPSVNCFARNNASIVDIYEQLDRIPSDLNKDSTIIFLSVGGNDILTNYVDKETSVENKDPLRPMFSAYKKLVKSIQTKMDLSKLILMTVYYPTNLKYSQYKPILQEWNKLVDDFAREENLEVVHIENMMVESSDFTLSIEPSETGGTKIANNILSTISAVLI